MSLREEVELYSKLTGRDGTRDPIVRIGAYLDGYEKGKEDHEPHWIPVTERLPEGNDYRPCYGYEDGAVWWRNDTGLMGLGWYYPSTDKWAYYDELDRCEKCVGNVVEWMPLPEPYKGVTE